MVSKNFYETQNIKLLKLFQELDVDRSGKIDVDELFTYYGKYFPGTETEVLIRIEKLIKKVDFDDNQQLANQDEKPSIDFEEFLVLSSRINKEFAKEKLNDVFNSLDTKNNGYLDIDDLRLFIKNPKITDDNLMKLIEKYDKNDDKKISFTEFFDMISE